ncbi:MAG: HAMP domain-containing sensor histidine kinase [Bacteroidetes bacterium]|nr:HAMP domain-containing sensor histidine kinase [Bacteroidota bacterium]
MYNDYKFTYANINKTAFNQELSRRGSYYANVVMWTTLFSLPLFILIDYLFCKDLWIDFLLIRLVGSGISYLIYYNASNSNWQYLKTIAWFVGVNVIINSIITALVPIDVDSPLSYFLILSIIMLIINTTIFWNPKYSIYTAAVSIIVIVAIYYLKRQPNKYTVLIEQGGGVYIIISAFACLLAYTRFNVLCRDAERSVMVDEANNKLIAKTELIKDEQFKVEETNRKLKTVSENSLDNMTVLMHDFKNFSETVKGSLDNLKSNADNLMPEQIDILNNLTVNHDKLTYMAEKLGDTANVVTTADSPDAAIHFNREDFDVNPEVEKAVMDIAETAMLKNMSLQLNISPAANHIYQDKLFTDQLLNKLMNNVIKLSESGSIITVRSEYVNGKAVIETVSHGAIIGMDKLEEMMNRLKYSSITDENALTNLGLIATKKLVESMNGTFTYNSENKTGNYFKVEFPSNNNVE